MATHSSILAWGSMGLRRVGHDCLTNTRTFTFMREGGLPPQTLTQNLGPLAQLIAYFSKQSDHHQGVATSPVDCTSYHNPGKGGFS